MNLKEAESIIEGLLFAAGDPVPIDRIAQVLGLDRQTVESITERLADYYSYERRGIMLVRLEDKLQLCTRREYGDYVRKILETRRAPSLSPAALEVLAIIAYRQPVTRTYVEKIRGVDSSYTVTSLAEKGLIEEAGRLEVPGKPILYRTTSDFLRCFGLTSVDELPELPELDAAFGEQMSLTELIREKETDDPKE